MTHPIFYDASGRRRHVAGIAVAVLTLAMALFGWWAATMLWAGRVQAPLRFAGEAAPPRAIPWRHPR